MDKQKRSPLKAKPLRNPGQSIEERMNTIMNDKIYEYMVLPIVFIVLAMLEWYRFLVKQPPYPWVMTSFAIIVTLFCVYRIRIHMKNYRNLKLGRDGERAVGQYLELLREKGFRIFHDLVGDGNFNLDHVIVSEHGVYVVETKTWSKPAQGEAIVHFNGKEIIVDGYNTGDTILKQVRAQRGWLQEVIQESTGKKIPVKPIVVFPGWYVEDGRANSQSDVWVLNPKALATFIGNVKPSLSNEDLMLVSYHLSRYIRTHNGN